MTHTLRLLDRALEIAGGGVVRIRRPNRDFLLEIRAEDFGYEELVEKAEARLEVTATFEASTLPATLNRTVIGQLLLRLPSALVRSISNFHIGLIKSVLQQRS